MAAASAARSTAPRRSRGWRASGRSRVLSSQVESPDDSESTANKGNETRSRFGLTGSVFRGSPQQGSEEDQAADPAGREQPEVVEPAGGCGERAPGDSNRGPRA